MSVRGSTKARVQKRVINHDRGGTFVMCAWDTCDRDGYQLYGLRQHEHARNIPCDSSLAKHITFVFCSDRHKQFWLNATGPNAHESAARNNGRIYGMLPAGYRASL